MGTIKARGQITIVDLNDGRSMNMYLNSNQPLVQIRNKTKYVPDYTTSNLVITPQLFVSGIDDDCMSECKSATWKINGDSNVANYGGSVAAENPYALTINQNMVNVSQLRIECSTIYNDTTTELDTTVKANITLARVDNGESSTTAVITTPDGTTISKAKGHEILSVRLDCDLYRGSDIDTTDVAYQWWKRNTDGTFSKLEEGTNYSGVTTRELTVKADGVDNFNVFKCIITDTNAGAETYGDEFAATVTVYDATDPYSIELTSTTGNVITKAAPSTTIKASVWQSGVLLSDEDHESFTYEWTQYDSTGTKATSIGKGTGKEGYRTRTITKDMISVRTTIVCEITI